MALTKSQFDKLYENAKTQDKNIRNNGSTPENVKAVSQKRFEQLYRDVQKEMQQGNTSPAVSFETDVKPDVRTVYEQNIPKINYKAPDIKPVKLPSVVENQGLYYAPDSKKNIIGAFGEGIAEGVKGFSSGVANVSDTLKSITRPAGELNRQLQNTYYDAGKASDIKDITENVVKQYGVNSRFNRDIQQNIKQRGQKQADNLAALYGKYADVPMSDAAVNAGQGVGNLLPSMAVNAATGGALGSAVFGTGVFGNAMSEALSSGATQDQAMMYAAADTALEVGIEKLFGGVPFLGDGKISVKGLTDRYIKTAAGQFLANRLADITGEGIEEVASGIIEPFLKRAFYDKNAEKASIKDLATAFGNGALVSAILGVANFGGNVAEYRQIKDKVTKARASENKDFTLSDTDNDVNASKTVRMQEKILDNPVSGINDFGQSGKPFDIKQLPQQKTAPQAIETVTNEQISENKKQPTEAKYSLADYVKTLPETARKNAELYLNKPYGDSGMTAGQFVEENIDGKFYKENKLYYVENNGRKYPVKKSMFDYAEFLQSTAKDTNVPGKIDTDTNVGAKATEAVSERYSQHLTEKEQGRYVRQNTKFKQTMYNGFAIEKVGDNYIVWDNNTNQIAVTKPTLKGIKEVLDKWENSLKNDIKDGQTDNLRTVTIDDIGQKAARSVNVSGGGNMNVADYFRIRRHAVGTDKYTYTDKYKEFLSTFEKPETVEKVLSVEKPYSKTSVAIAIEKAVDNGGVLQDINGTSFLTYKRDDGRTYNIELNKTGVKYARWLMERKKSDTNTVNQSERRKDFEEKAAKIRPDHNVERIKKPKTIADKNTNALMDGVTEFTTSRKNDVQGYNRAQREQIKDELIAGLDTDNEKTTVNVEGDGTLNLVNNEKAVGTVLAKLGYKAVEQAEQTAETKETAVSENPYGSAKVVGKRGNVDILDSIPEGWRKFDMMTAPVGYVGVTNNKSLFGGERKTALVAENVFRDNSATDAVDNTTDIDTENTKINDNPDTHTPEEMKVINEFKNAVDADFVDYIQRARTDAYVGNYTVTKTNSRTEQAMRELTGLQKVGSNIVANKNTIQHIDNGHGKSGDADSTMVNDEDIARMKYVIDNFDNAYLSITDTKATKLKNGYNAPKVIFEKKVDGTYVVVEAVTDANSNNNLVIGAFFAKNGIDKTKIKEEWQVSKAESDKSQSADFTAKPLPSASSNLRLPQKAENSQVKKVENFLDEYIENLSPMQKASVKKTLSVELKDDSGQVVTRAKWVEDKISQDGNADNFVINRYKKAVPDGTKKTIDNAFIRANENMVKQKCGSYWVDNRETRAFMKNPMDRKRREAAKKSILDNAAPIKVEYGYKNPDNSTAVLTKTEYDYAKHLGNNLPESVGAMKASPKKMSHYVNEYGEIKPGENPERFVSAPVSVDGVTKVGKFARTAMEAKATSDKMVEAIEKAVVRGEFSHEIYKDKKALDEAVGYIEKYGYQKAYEEFENRVNNHKEITKGDMTQAMVMYAVAVENDDITTALDLAVKINKAAVNAGQVVQSVRLLKKSSPEGRLYYAQKSLEAYQEEVDEKYGDKAPKLKVDQDILDTIKDARTEAEIEEATAKLHQVIADQLPFNWSNFMSSWRYLAMLGNPRTQMRNVISNTVNSVASEYVNFVQSSIEKARGKERSTTIRKPTKAQTDFAEKDYQLIKKQLSGEGKYQNDSLSSIERLKNPFSFPTFWGKEGDQYIGWRGAVRKAGEPLLKGVSKWNDATTKAMEKGDLIFSERAYKKALARYLKANNINPDNISMKQLSDARAWATKQSLESVFRENNQLANWISRQERNLMNSHSKSKKTAGVALGGLMPFRKTPLNITKRAFEYTPIGIIKGLYEMKSDDVYMPNAINDLAKGFSGTSLIMLGAAMAKYGLLSGGLGYDKEDKMKKQMGRQSYSINIGDWSYTLDWGGAALMPLFVGADIYESNSEDENWLMNIGNALANAGSPIIETSMMTGLMDALQSASYEDNDIKKLATAASSAMANYIGQFVPTIMGQVARAVDDTSRSSYTSAKGVFRPIAKTAEKIQNKVPGWSKLNVPYMDVWGNDVKNVGGNFAGRLAYNMLSPGYAEKKSNDKVEKMLTDLYDKTGDTGVLPSNYTTYKRMGDETIRFTDKQYETYTKAYGQTAYGILDDLSGDRGFKSMGDAYRAEIVGKVYKYSTAIASNEVVNKELTARQANQQTAMEHGISPYQVFGGLIEADGMGSEGNANGSLSKSEVMAYIESQGGLSNTEKAYLFAALGNSNWINPYI